MNHSRSLYRHWAPFLIPAFLYFVLFLVVPLGVVLFTSFLPNQLVEPESPLANYLFFFERQQNVQAIWRSLRLSLSVCILSVCIGYGAALSLRHLPKSLGSVPILLLAFHILSGPIVTVLGWMILMTSQGAASSLVRILGQGLGLQTEGLRLLGSETAVLIGLVHFTLAFVILNLINVLLAIDIQLEEAARNLGAKPWQVFWYIIFPLSRPGLLSAGIVSFALSINAYVNPTFLGNQSRPVMTMIVRNYIFVSYNWPLAAVSSVVLLLISLVVVLTAQQIFRLLDRGGVG